MGHTIRSMGWSVREDSDDQRWHFVAFFDGRREEGIEDTFAQAIGAAKEAYGQLEHENVEPLEEHENS